jgi:excisionase family DNA binding protein
MTTESKPRASAEPKRPYSERSGALLTVKEVADELASTERMVNRLIADGRLTPTYVGKHKRIHRDDLRTFIEANRRPAER